MKLQCKLRHDGTLQHDQHFFARINKLPSIKRRICFTSLLGVVTASSNYCVLSCHTREYDELPRVHDKVPLVVFRIKKNFLDGKQKLNLSVMEEIFSSVSAKHEPEEDICLLFVIFPPLNMGDVGLINLVLCAFWPWKQTSTWIQNLFGPNSQWWVKFNLG